MVCRVAFHLTVRTGTQSTRTRKTKAMHRQQIAALIAIHTDRWWDGTVMEGWKRERFVFVRCTRAGVRRDAGIEAFYSAGSPDRVGSTRSSQISRQYG